MRWFALLLLLGGLLYGPTIGAKYFADDFLFLFDGSCTDLARPFLNKSPSGWDRPIEAALLTCIQSRFHLNTVPIHLIGLTLHAALSFLVFTALLRLGAPRYAAMLGSVFMLISQANVAAVAGNDTMSQVGGTAFGCLSVWHLHVALSRGCRGSDSTTAPLRHLFATPEFLVSLTSFALALLSKETSVSFLLLTGVIALVHHLRSPGETSRLGRVVATLLPFVVVASAYLAIRTSLGVARLAFGPGRYNLNLGPNVLKNLTMLGLAMLIPVSSVSAFTAFSSGRTALFGALISTAIVVLVLMIGGLRHSGRSGMTIVLAMLAVLALVPMILLNRVSELYAYNAMPFLSVLAGIAVTGYAERPPLRPAVAAVLIILLASHFAAARSKAALMQENGERAATLLEQIDRFARMVPAGGELLLVSPQDGSPQYSNFLMPGFDVFRYGERTIARAAARDDIRIRIVRRRDLEQVQAAGAIILSLEGDTVRREWR